MQRKASLIIAVLLAVFMVSVLTWQIKPSQATYVFNDGFESGQINPSPGVWTSNKTDALSTLEVIAGAKHSGTYGCYGKTVAYGGPGDYCVYNIASTPKKAYARMYVQFLGQTGGTSVHTYLVSLVDSAYSGKIMGSINLYKNSSGGYQWEVQYQNPGGTTNYNNTLMAPAPSIGTSTWYCIELEVSLNVTANTGFVAVWVDGTLFFNQTGLDNAYGTSAALSSLWCGSYINGANIVVESYWDNCVLDSSYIGVETPADTSKPTYALINASTIISGQICIFSCNWTDETALSGYIFGTNNTGSWINETWITMTSWANVTKTLNATDAFVVQFEWWANDTSNNWNNTGVQSITLTSTDVLPYLAMGGILGGTGVLAIFLIRKKKNG